MIRLFLNTLSQITAQKMKFSIKDSSVNVTSSIYHLKSPQNLYFSDIFRRYRKRLSGTK